MSYESRVLPIDKGGTNSISAQASRLALGNLGILSTITGIDGTSVSATNLFTVPANRKVVVTGAIIRVTAVSGLVSVATAGIGIATGESDIFPATALTSLSSTSSVFNFFNNNLVSTIGNAGEVIKFGIDVAYVATSITLAVDLLGYLIEV